jgi:hypothetical protein
LELSRDPDLVAGAEYGAFPHGIHVQLTSDLRQSLRALFYAITELREIVRKALICAKSVINSSVTPSAQ